MTDKKEYIDEAIDRAIFDQMDNEDDDWYDRFFTFYVKLGRARTLRHAYLLHQEFLEDQAQYAPSYEKWKEQAKHFSWKKRAAAYDYEKNIEAQLTVEEARSRLMEASVRAVTALERSLGNARTRVSGAKAILDRAGLPPVKEIKHSSQPFSADELAQAAEELDEWQDKITGSNGSNADSQ